MNKKLITIILAAILLVLIVFVAFPKIQEYRMYKKSQKDTLNSITFEKAEDRFGHIKDKK